MAEVNVPGGPGAADTDEDDRRRRIILWILLLVALLILLWLFAVCAGGGEEPVVAPAPATTAPPATPAPTTTTTAAPATPAPTTTAAPTTTPAPTTTTPPTTPASTTTTQPGPIDVAGVWAFLIDVTRARGICSGEEDEKVQDEEVTIRQDGTTLSVTGLNRDDPPWEGEIVDNTVTFGGERDEDRGRTTAMFTLTVDDAGTMMSGEEVWAWSGPGGSCRNSLSEVTAERAT